MALFDEAITGFGQLKFPFSDLHTVVQESPEIEQLSQRPNLHVDSIASILYTSGITGDQGCDVESWYFTAMLGSWDKYSRWVVDRVLSVLPHHTFNLVVIC